MTTTNRIDPLRAATADRLTLMFTRATAYPDDRVDIGLAVGVLPAHCHANASFLMSLSARLGAVGVDESVTLTYEERVALYVASKVLVRESAA